MNPSDLPVDVEDAERGDEGLSNDIFFTEDRVVKVYSWFPVTALIASLGTVFSGPELFTREKRMVREEQSLDFFEASEFDAPEILEASDNVLVFERVEGDSGFEWVDSLDDSEEAGERFRRGLVQLHDQGFALRDARLTNFIVSDGVFSIDHEFCDVNSNFFSEFVDWLTLTSSARQTSSYNGFIRGLRPGLGARFLSFFTAFFHALLLERSKKRLRNWLRSVT